METEASATAEIIDLAAVRAKRRGYEEKILPVKLLPSGPGWELVDGNVLFNVWIREVANVAPLETPSPCRERRDDRKDQ
jgi:hypothetical protein